MAELNPDTLDEGADAPFDQRRFVVALARGLELLRCFRPGETLLGNGEFATRTGLPKATVNRLAYTLSELGYLRYDARLGKYALDAGVLSLGYALIAGSDVISLARPHMDALARELGAAVSLGCRQGFEMTYLLTLRSETALTLGLAPGSLLSMLTSSMGRAYLAVQPVEVRARLMKQLERRAPPGMGAQQVEAAWAQIDIFAREGCCYSFQDWHNDVNAVAVPFRDPRQDRWLVLSCSGPASSMPPAVFSGRIAPRLRALAARLGTIDAG